MRSASCGFCHIRCCSSRQSSMLTSRRPFVYADTCVGTTQLELKMGQFSKMWYSKQTASDADYNLLCSLHSKRRLYFCWAISGGSRAWCRPPRVPWQAGGGHITCADRCQGCARVTVRPAPCAALTAIITLATQPILQAALQTMWRPACIGPLGSNLEPRGRFCGRPEGCRPRGTFMRAMAFTRRRSDT